MARTTNRGYDWAASEATGAFCPQGGFLGRRVFSSPRRARVIHKTGRSHEHFSENHQAAMSAIDRLESRSVAEAQREIDDGAAQNRREHSPASPASPGGDFLVSVQWAGWVAVLGAVVMERGALGGRGDL